jgi:hypothetical protein
MKYAIVDGLRQEAQPNLLGKCPGCGGPTVAKCGEVRVSHWAHRGRRACDPWWENETPWHRAWKDVFLAEWQEIVHPAENGERHIADVKTPDGWVIEFQHSYLEPAERRSRDAFYPKLLWVVDGMRRKRDLQQFNRALKEGNWFGSGQRIRQVWTGDCALLREWAESARPVFFDFGEPEQLYWVLSKQDAWAHVAQFPRREFIAAHRITAGEVFRAFEKFVADLPKLIADDQRQRMMQATAVGLLQPRRIRRRFRF